MPANDKAAEPTDCPACGRPDAGPSSYIRFCGTCGHRWLNRSEEDHQSVEAAIFTSDYAGYRPDPAYLEAVTKFGRTDLITRITPPGRVLDVGCGAGDFMTVAQTLGYEVEGIDISEASAAICRARQLNARAADFLTCDLAGNYDLIAMWDVVAHLRNPADFVSRARSLLSDRGALFIKTPGFGELSVRLSNRWPRVGGSLIGAPSHCQFFDRESLSVLVSRAGLEPEWLNGGRARSRAAGGSLKRRAARAVRKLASRLSGDSNLYVIARPAR